MKTHDITEQAYKNGYEKGYKDGKRDAVKHGQWNKIDRIQLPLIWKYRCSVCGCPQDYKHNHCPHCGAKMDGAEDG